MKPILVAVDFTDRAREVAYYAADMALAIQADLYVFHAVQIPVSPAETPVGYVFEQLMESAEQSLNAWAEELRLRTKNQVTVNTVLEVGGLAFQLQEVCERVKPFLVVMGGMSDAYERVLVIPPGAVFHRIGKVGIACELGEVRNGPVSWAFLKELQQLFAAHFDILNVKTAKEGTQDKAMFELYQWKESLEELGPALHFIPASTVEEGINRYLGEQAVDWLMVFPRRHEFLSFHRSESKRIVRHCPVPVLSIYEPAVMQAGEH